MINNSNITKLNKLVFKIFGDLTKKKICNLNKRNTNPKNNIPLIKFIIKKFSDYTPLTLPKKDLYKTLGISSTSDFKEIKEGYYKKAKEYHPDKFANSAKIHNKKEFEELFREAKIAYEVLSDSKTRKDYDNYVYSLYFNKNINKDYENIKMDSSYEESYMNSDSHFTRYQNDYPNNNFNQSYYYNPKTNNYYKNTKSTFTFVDPKTGRMHKININKSEKANVYDNQFFYENEEFARRMRDRQNNQNDNNFNSYASNTSQNSYEDVGAEGAGYGYRKRNYPDDSSFFHNNRNQDDSFIIAFSFKHYLTFVFIIVTVISFAIFIKKNPPNGDPFIYKNSVYYPKDKDPILRSLIRMNKVDAYQLDRMNYTGGKYYD